MKAADLPLPLLLPLAPLAGLALNVAAQVVIGRLGLSIGMVRRQLVCFGLGFALSLALLAGWTLPVPAVPAADRLAYLALNLLAYAFAGFVFFNVINLNLSSLRVRMLKECLRTDPQPLALETLREKYSARQMLEARLERLRAGGQLQVRDGRYYFVPRAVARIGHFFAFLQRVLLRQP